MTISRRDACLPVPFRRAARIAAAFSILGVGWSAQAAPPVARQSFTVTDFDTVRLEAPVDVSIVTGKGAAAAGTGDRDMLDRLTLDISSRVLTIRARETVTLGGSGGKMRVPTSLTLTTGDLLRASVNGPGRLTVDRLKGARVEATVRGSGRLTVARIDADKADVGLLGSGTLIVAGTALDLAATASGSGRLDATALDARRVRVTTEGSGDLSLNAREEAVAVVNGTGQVVVAGKAKCTVRKMGSASVRCGGGVY